MERLKMIRCQILIIHSLKNYIKRKLYQEKENQASGKIYSINTLLQSLHFNIFYLFTLGSEL